MTQETTIAQALSQCGQSKEGENEITTNSGAEGALLDEPQKKEETRQCSLSAKQLEEIYAKLTMEERRLVFEWVKGINGVAPYFTIPEGESIYPTLWQIRRLDTCRYKPFSWIAMKFRIIPSVDNKEELFKKAMAVLRRVAISFSILLSRWESVKEGIVIATNVPMKMLQVFVESCYTQDRIQLKDRQEGTGSDNPESAKLISEEGERLRTTWKDAGISPEIYRLFSYSIFRVRGQEDPPAVVLASLVDNQHCVVLFRHNQLLQGSYFLRLPGLGPCIDWPINDHPPSSGCPRVLCGNTSCENWEGYPDAVNHIPDGNMIMATYNKHLTQDYKDLEADCKREARKVWNEQFEPQARDEAARIVLDLKEKNTDQDVINKAEAEIYLKWDNKMDDEVVRLRRELLQSRTARLRPCARCKMVRYCSESCQREDWAANHKAVCKRLCSKRDKVTA